MGGKQEAGMWVFGSPMAEDPNTRGVSYTAAVFSSDVQCGQRVALIGML